MPAGFYERLADYLSSVGEVLRGEAAAASILPNSSDVGQARELIYAEFLRNHVPANCNVFLGGFVFDLEGNESKQLDIVITANTCPQYILPSGAGSSVPKRFACIEGTIAVASVKSTLTSTELVNSLDNLASIPFQLPLGDRHTPMVTIPNYDGWPYKIIYANNGASLVTLLKTIGEYYEEHPEIPLTRQPDIIHVAGKYNVLKIGPEGGSTRNGTQLDPGAYYGQPDENDIFALQHVIQEIQQKALSAQHLIISYWEMMNHLPIATKPGTFKVLLPRE